MTDTTPSNDERFDNWLRGRVGRSLTTTGDATVDAHNLQVAAGLIDPVDPQEEAAEG